MWALAVNVNTGTGAAIMPLKRLYVAERIAVGKDLHLGDEAARYLGRVLRLRTGENVQIFNGEDGEWSATIARFRRDRVTLAVHDFVREAEAASLRIQLVQGISRGERMDFVVQKATELGVDRITPVLTDHGVVRLDAKRTVKRRRHWQRVSQSACEQSGRVRPPQVDAPLPLNDWFGSERGSATTDLILAPHAGTRFANLDAPAAGLRLLIGPEGGFSEREYDDAGVAGFESVSLGPRILRTETAALAAIAIAQGFWGDL